MNDYNTDVYITSLQQQIVKLKEDATNNEGVMVALREGYTEAKERIEELEKERKVAEDLIERSQDKGFHIYTNDQITCVSLP